MPRFVAYCRTSTENQKEEKTIELQVESITKYASGREIEIVEWFKDEGVSGGLEQRPALVNLLKYLETNADVQGVIIYKLDRLARDLYIQEGLIREFSKFEKQVISTLEPNLDNTDPFRKAFRQMLGIFAEFEKAMITLRMKNGRNSSVAKGNWHGGQVYGYDHDGNGRLIINEHEAEIVRRVYYLKRYKNMSAHKIAKLFTKEKIPTKRGKEKWRAITIKKILKNKTYKGLILYNGQLYKGNHKTIIN